MLNSDNDMDNIKPKQLDIDDYVSLTLTSVQDILNSAKTHTTHSGSLWKKYLVKELKAMRGLINALENLL